MKTLQGIKQRFEIIGNNLILQKSLEKAIQVADTEISVLIIGESGVGKESVPKIIHQLSARKHYPYIAVNCGAIPEGTIDSELFGHEKGSFTGATNNRKGYFEVADKGTIFLDEVGELPLSTQVRLLRVLESKEFIKVGSSQIQKSDVRIVAATNVNMVEAIKRGKFREDLYYRLNTIQIDIPALRERKDDISLLFRKFSNDFAEKNHHNKPIKLTEAALAYLENYPWPGNIRQLRNFAQELSIMEPEKEITLEKVKEYLPNVENSLSPQESFSNEYGIIDLEKYSNNLKNSISEIIRNEQNPTLPPLKNFSNTNIMEIIYKMFFDIINLRKDLNDLKNLTSEIIRNQVNKANFIKEDKKLIKNVFEEADFSTYNNEKPLYVLEDKSNYKEEETHSKKASEKEFIHNLESFSLQEKEKELIRKALEKNKGKRKIAAKELGISERTLYRKIKEYDL